MTRLTLTATTAACFFAAYLGYAHWIGVLTAMEEPPPGLPASVDAPVQPEIVRTIAEQALRQLPGQDWLQNPKFAFQRSDEVLLFTQHVDPEDDGNGNRVRFQPLVMVWNNHREPDQPPYVIWCETARVQFERPFRLQFGAGSPGRLVAAAFDGQVVISGPDGLRIQGQDFRFAEEYAERSPHLYSDQHVTFQYGPRRDDVGQFQGHADGLQIDLLPSDRTDNSDMPRVAGIDRVRLRQNVRLEFTFEERLDAPRRSGHAVETGGPGPRMGQATVTSDGSLEYQVATRIATLEDNVLVDHPTPAADGRPQADRLHCDTLALLFEESPVPTSADTRRSSNDNVASAGTVALQPPADPMHPLPRLRLKQLAASGRRAALQLEQRQLVANMHTLRYDAASHEVVLLDSESVRVQQQSIKLMSPEVRLVHTPDGELNSLECLGAGQLEQRNDEDGQVQMRAYWNDRMRIAPDPETGLTLVRAGGQARVVQPGRSSVSADRLVLWVDGDAPRRFTTGSNDSRGSHGQLSALRFALAEGNVRMAAREFHVETARLQAVFEAVPPHPPAAAAQASVEAPRRDDADMRADQQRRQWVAQADEIRVHLRQAPDPHNPAQPVTEVTEATATGNLLLLQSEVPSGPDPARDPNPPLSISGSRVHLTNPGNSGQIVTLTGAPAHVRRGPEHLEGNEIRLDRAANLIQVIGQGMLQSPVPESISGQLLQPGSDDIDADSRDRNPGQTPPAATALLDVHWQEGMTFDGLQATFLKNVALKLNESRLYCEEMHVRLNQPMSFTGDLSDAPQPQIRQVQCKDGVRLEIYSWEGSRLTGIRKMELAEFTLDAETGDLIGLGKGTINDWARAAGRRVELTPSASAQANQPADSDGREWEFTNVEFTEKLTGNTRERIAQLHGRVRLTYAPVDHAQETFSRDDFSRDKSNAADAVWLGCDTLSLRLFPWPDRTGSYAMLGARGQCELEGARFRAVADMLSYNESQKMFTLKGESPREAIIYYRERPGAEPRPNPAQVIEFVPSENRIRVQGSSGFQGGP
jgi:hypothetical protein